MAHHVELELGTLQVSSTTHGLSLSLTSTAFIDTSRASNVTLANISSLIQSKQLWLLPRGVCRMDISLSFGGHSLRGEEQDRFVDLVVDTVCASPVWSRLGLTVQIMHVQYHQGEGNDPSIYLGIGQPDMSSALVSPPQTYTAHLIGTECILQFESSKVLNSNSDSAPSSSHPDELVTCHRAHSVELWEHSAELVESAFLVTLGTRKRIQGLQICNPNRSPTLLDLAPAIYNSHYRKSITSLTKIFPAVASIFALSLDGQSPELRRNGEELLRASSAYDSNRFGQQSSQVESYIQRTLWNLLRDTMKPTVGTSNTKAGNRAQPVTETNHQDDVITPTNSQHFEPDLSNSMPDQFMSNDMYDRTHDLYWGELPGLVYDEDYSMYGYGYDYTAPEERGLDGYNVIDTPHHSMFTQY